MRDFYVVIAKCKTRKVEAAIRAASTFRVLCLNKNRRERGDALRLLSLLFLLRHKTRKVEAARSAASTFRVLHFAITT